MERTEGSEEQAAGSPLALPASAETPLLDDDDGIQQSIKIGKAAARVIDPR
jgi:hypothetical protein